MLTFKDGKKRRPQKQNLSDKNIRQELTNTDVVYVFGCTDTDRVKKIIQSQYNTNREIEIRLGTPVVSPALCAKVGDMRSRLADTRLQFFYR